MEGKLHADLRRRGAARSAWKWGIVSEAPAEPAPTPPLRVLTLATGASLALLGSMATLGWLLHIPALVQFLHPWADLMVLNSTSALLLTGLALTLAVGRRRSFGTASERSQAETLIEDQFIREVAERRVAEQERDKFFSLSIDMLCISNGDGYFKRLNPAFEHTLGYTVEELTDRPFLDFVHPDDAAVTLAEVEKQLSAGMPALHFENRYRCKDGTYRWLAWTSMPDVETGMMYALARDVTARKSLEAEREELILELQSTLAQVRTLSTMLPMCSGCRRIRDDGDGTWSQLELYLSKTHSGTQVSHGICPECMGRLYPDQVRRIEARKRKEKA
jgi:PAS domain S-box-containing protein